jgi:hypothetical protein
VAVPDIHPETPEGFDASGVFIATFFDLQINYRQN